VVLEAALETLTMPSTAKWRQPAGPERQQRKTGKLMLMSC
jgi:hypothetical protein